MRTAARLGIGARAMTGGPPTWPGHRPALGSAPAQADSTGALAEVGHRTGGTALLIVLAVGLACYAGWRLLEGWSGGRKPLQRVGSFGIVLI